MNPNQKIFVFGSVGLLAFSLFLGSLHSEEGTFPTAAAAEPVIAAPAEPAADAAPVEVAALEEAAPEAAVEAATEPDSAIEAALKAEAALSAVDSEPVALADAPAASEPIAAVDAPPAASDAAPADAASPDCAKSRAANSDCDKARSDCDKAKSDCDKAKRGSADCDKSASSCNKASGCAGGHCAVGGIACGLACKLDLSDEQQGRIDTVVAGYRAEAASLGSSKKQAKQELRALWEASPIKPAAIQKKAAQANALGLAKRAATTKAKLDLAAVLTAGQYDSVDHLFSACEGKSKSGKGGARIASADCASGNCKR